MREQTSAGDHADDFAFGGRSDGRLRIVSTTLTWTAVFDEVEDGWIQGRIAELPGVITAAPSLEQAKDDLVDALHEYLASLAEPSNETATDSGIREPVPVVIGI